MEFLNGQRTDEKPINQTPNSWRHAKNMLLNRNFKSISNEPGFVLDIKSVNGVAQDYLPYQIIGVINTGISSVIFTATAGGDSEIGFLKDGIYNTVINDPILNFGLDRPIEGVFKINFNGQIIVAWWEGVEDTANVVRILNINNLPFSLTGYALTNPNDLKLLELFAPAIYPLINAYPEDGGSLKTGTYHIVTTYERRDGSTIGWSIPTNPIYIFDEPITSAFNNTDGEEPGSASTKRITINITDVDISYSYIQIGVIKKIGGIVTAVQFDRVPINGNTINTYYTGDEIETALSLSEVLVSRVTYPYAKTGTILSDRLHLGNVRTRDVVDFQKYANNIKVKWTSDGNIATTQNINSYKDGKISFSLKSFQADEVYALYIAFIMNDLSISSAFHIPGRTALPGDTDLLSTIDPILYAEDIAIDANMKKFHTRNTAKRDGTMGYWENAIEKYPDHSSSDIYDSTGQIGTLRNTPVRHHKFPSLSNLERWGYRFNKNVKKGVGDIFQYVRQASALSYTAMTTIVDDSLADYVQVTNLPALREYRFQMDESGATGSGSTRYFNTSFNTSAEDQENGVVVNNCRVRFDYDQQNVHLDMTWWLEFGIVDVANNPYVVGLDINISLFDKNDNLISTIYTDSSVPLAMVRVYAASFNTTFDVNEGDYLLFNIKMSSATADNPTDIVVFRPYNVFNIAQKSIVKIYSNTPQPLALTGTTASDQPDGATKPLGISLSDIYIPTELEGLVQGFVILHAERNENNISIIGQSPLLHDRWYKNDEATDPNYDTYYRFYDFNMLKYKPSTLPTYFKNELLLTARLDAKAISDVSNPSGQYLYKPIMDSMYDDTDYPSTALYSRYNAANTDYHPREIIRGIETFQYIPPRVFSTVCDNSNREEFIYIRFKNNGTNSILPVPIIQFITPFLPVTPTDMVNIGVTSNYFGNLKIHRTETYSSFKDQTLVSTGRIFKTTGVNNYTVDKLYGGDVFRTPYGFKVLTDPNSFNPTHADSSRVYALVESTANIQLRHNGSTPADTYFPRNQVTYNDSVYFYNKDYSAINNLFQFFPADELQSSKKTTKFPTRIPRSIVSQNEEYAINWNIFLPFDYYEMPKDKGSIWKLATMDRTLLINLERAFFTAMVKDQISTDSFKVYMGTGDIFDRPPVEAIPINGGYAGCRSQWGAVVTKQGYVFADKSQGKIFIFSGQLKEITTDGNSLFFWNKMREQSTVDNPFITYGLTMGYDEEWNRLIVSQKGFYVDPTTGITQSRNFTKTYNFDINQWISDHDYNPNYMFSNREKLYAVYNKGNKSEIYQFNEGKNGTYFDAQVYPSYIDLVFNSDKQISKIFDNVEWLTDVEDSITGGRLFNKTFTHMMVYNANQCSAILDLRNKQSWLGKSARNVEETWKANNFRDMVIDPNLPFLDEDGNVITTNINPNKTWLLKNIFIGKFGIVRFIYDNADSNTIALHDANIAYSPSAR